MPERSGIVVVGFFPPLLLKKAMKSHFFICGSVVLERFKLKKEVGPKRLF